MYEEKQFRLWMMSIPFWILHFFGANAIFSNYDFLNEMKESFFVERSCTNNNGLFIFQDFAALVDCTKSSAKKDCINLSAHYKHFMLHEKCYRHANKEKVMLCDSRFRSPDTDFTGYLCALKSDKTYRSSIYV